MAIHPSVTIDRLLGLVEGAECSLDNPGVCLACGEDADSCEPDARGYPCEECEQPRVYGASEALMMLA